MGIHQNKLEKPCGCWRTKSQKSCVVFSFHPLVKYTLQGRHCNIPKSDMHANPKSDMHANPKNDMHANPKSEMHANPKNDMHANPKSDMHDI